MRVNVTENIMTGMFLQVQPDLSTSALQAIASDLTQG